MRDRRLGVSKMGQRVGQICRGSDVGRGRDGKIRQVPSVIVAEIERAGEIVPRDIQPALIEGQDAKPDVAGDCDAIVWFDSARPSRSALISCTDWSSPRLMAMAPRANSERASISGSPS